MPGRRAAVDVQVDGVSKRLHRLLHAMRALFARTVRARRGDRAGHAQHGERRDAVRHTDALSTHAVRRHAHGYGIVCDPCNPEAIARIYEAKGRPQYKALQVIMASVDDLDALGLELPAPLNRLAAQFLPGAFSPIAVARDSSPLATVRVAANGVRTQGIRVPNSAMNR